MLRRVHCIRPTRRSIAERIVGMYESLNQHINEFRSRLHRIICNIECIYMYLLRHAYIYINNNEYEELMSVEDRYHNHTEKCKQGGQVTTVNT